jgi:hypothetical protein
MSLNFKNLNVASLDYNEIIQSLKEFLKSEPTLKDLDYDSEASAVNMLLNIMATTTAYNGIYAQMGYKESFLSTATMLSSIMGLASNSSVLIEAKKSASTTRNIIVYGTTLDAYTPFYATSTKGTDLVFFNTEDVSANTTATITLYGGTEVIQYGDWDFNSQSMTLPLEVDPNTITLTIVDTAGNLTQWEKVDKSNPAVTSTGNYFTVLNTVNGYLVTANLPESNSITTDYTVYCRAVISNGSDGNEATLDLTNNYAGFLTVTTPTGGYNTLSASVAKSKVNFEATSQHRCVTLNDFKNAIMVSSIISTTENNITVANADQPSTVKIYVNGATESQINQLMTYLGELAVAGTNLIYSQ